MVIALPEYSIWAIYKWVRIADLRKIQPAARLTPFQSFGSSEKQKLNFGML